MDRPQQQEHIQLTATTQPLDAARLDNTDNNSMCRSLYQAVWGGRTETVVGLLLVQQHGAATDSQAAGIIMHGQCDILEVTAERNTILHVAAEQGHGELILELLDRFRDKGLLSRQNMALDTPLHCAARAGHVSSITALVQLARDCGEGMLGSKNEAGDTALHLAARHGHGQAVEVLMSAAVEEPAAGLNNAGMSPLYLAVMSGSVEAVRAITTRSDASAAGPSSQNALHAAVFQSSKMVDLLLEWRPGLADEVDSSGSSPLHFASSDGGRAVVNAILRAAPPGTVYKKDCQGLSALHVAARMGHHRAVEDVLSICPHAAELRDDGGGTFQHAAAMKKRYSVVSLAIKNPMLRGLLDAQDRDGNTPLHLAVAAGAPNIVEALLRKGNVQADVLNNGGHTAFDLTALSTSFFTTVNLVVTLVAYGAHFRPQRQDHLEQWTMGSARLPPAAWVVADPEVSRKHENRNEPDPEPQTNRAMIGLNIQERVEKTCDILAVVAGLIVTSAFAAGFNVPGGYNGEGKANLKDEIPFKVFMVLDAVAVAASVVAVVLLVYGKVSRIAGSWKTILVSLHCLWLSLNCLMLALYVALTVTGATRAVYVVLLAVIACIVLLNVFIGTWIGPATKLRTTCRFLWKRCHLKRWRVIRRQYPLASASVLNLFVFTVIGCLPLLGIYVYEKGILGLDG